MILICLLIIGFILVSIVLSMFWSHDLQSSFSASSSASFTTTTNKAASRMDAIISVTTALYFIIWRRFALHSRHSITTNSLSTVWFSICHCDSTDHHQFRLVLCLHYHHHHRSMHRMTLPFTTMAQQQFSNYIQWNTEWRSARLNLLLSSLKCGLHFASANEEGCS